jgi:hypothetical protein
MNFFHKLLAEQGGTEWATPGAKAATEDANLAHDLVDDDPGKKMFWHTIPGVYDPVPFPGWGDPNAEPNHNYPAYAPTQFTNCCGDMSPAPIVDPHNTESINDENIFHIQGVTEGLTGEQIKVLNNLGFGSGGGLKVTPCETIMVNGVCTMPCKSDDPLCKDDGNDPIVVIPPVIIGPDPSPPVIGGGGVGPIGGGGGSGGGLSVGGVPEPSTWMLMISGFALMTYLGWRRQCVNL